MLKVTKSAGVTFPEGFEVAVFDAGFRNPNRLDLAIVVNKGPRPSSAAVLTTNELRAASILDLEPRRSQIRVVSINSGSANACTGELGPIHQREATNIISQALRVSPQVVAVLSTGKIGTGLELDKFASALANAPMSLTASPEADIAAADAIRTTDSGPKLASVQANGFRVGGMAKGAGMMSPGLATMIVTLTTDAVVESEVLQRALTKAAQHFGATEIDNCMSTNDAVVLMASGASGVRASETQLTAALSSVCENLSNQLRFDSEATASRLHQRGLIPVLEDGRTLPKTAKITINGASNDLEAHEFAKEMSKAPLLRADLTYSASIDAGSIAALVGSTAANTASAFDPHACVITIDDRVVFKEGKIVAQPPARIDGTTDIQVTIGTGNGRATIHTPGLLIDYSDEPAFPGLRRRKVPKNCINHYKDHHRLLPNTGLDPSRTRPIDRIYLVARATSPNGVLTIPARDFPNDIPITVVVPPSLQLTRIETDLPNVEAFRFHHTSSTPGAALANHPIAIADTTFRGVLADARNAAQLHARWVRNASSIVLSESQFIINQDVISRLQQGLALGKVAACTETGPEDHSPVGDINGAASYAGLGCAALDLNSAHLFSAPGSYSGDYGAIADVVREGSLIPIGSVTTRPDVWQTSQFHRRVLDRRAGAIERFDAVAEATNATLHNPNTPPLTTKEFWESFIPARANHIDEGIFRRRTDYEEKEDDRAWDIATLVLAKTAIEETTPQIMANYCQELSEARNQWHRAMCTRHIGRDSYHFEPLPVFTYSPEVGLFSVDRSLDPTSWDLRTIQL